MEPGHNYGTFSRVSSHGNGILASGLRTCGHRVHCAVMQSYGFPRIWEGRVQGAQTTASVPVVGKVDLCFYCSHCREEHHALVSDRKDILLGMGYISENEWLGSMNRQ